MTCPVCTASGSGTPGNCITLCQASGRAETCPVCIENNSLSRWGITHRWFNPDVHPGALTHTHVARVDVLCEGINARFESLESVAFGQPHWPAGQETYRENLMRRAAWSSRG